MDRSFNRIELRGNVGQDARIVRVGDNTVARFNIATNETYKDRSGSLREETTWHSVTAWAGKGMPDFTRIKKGVCLYVLGRLRQCRYTTAGGEEKSFYEVLASRVNIEDAQMP
ncbi:MAG TPA: single-stranded DNA-binding protein [Candidatus Coprenecus merdipullorum]|nr:single-stranded DNA-binding protein [Candidatus Coprenecus merdipullorum]